MSILVIDASISFPMNRNVGTPPWPNPGDQWTRIYTDEKDLCTHACAPEVNTRRTRDPVARTALSALSPTASRPRGMHG